MWFHVRLLERCNLFCSHCYAKHRGRSATMPFAMVERIVDQIGTMGNTDGEGATVYLSGGEPFLHPDILKIIDYIRSAGFIDRINVLTNGVLIGPYIPALRDHASRCAVQVSIDGDRKVHDAIRGEGTYLLSKQSLYALNEAGIVHWISYTVSRNNAGCCKAVLDLAKATGSRFNNVTPYTGDPEMMLTYPEWKEFKYRYTGYAAEIGLSPSLGARCCGFKYRCGAYTGGLTINPDGTATGCARQNRSEGTYDNLLALMRNEEELINATCMHASWSHEPHFDLITRLE
jgi:MoaA/NifB/PqqE/SkfB family radical SAM enzyme